MSIGRVAGQFGLDTIISSILVVLAMPLGERSYLGWFAFVPLLRFLRYRGFIPAVITTLITMFLAAELSISGIFYSSVDPYGSRQWVLTGFFIFALSTSIPIGAWGDKGGEGLRTWWFAALAVLMEAFLLIQLPVHLALSQYRNVPVVELSAVGGIWLVSFLMWWCNYLLATLPIRKLLILIPVIGIVSYGSSRVTFPVSGPRPMVAVIQISEPDQERLTTLQSKASKWDPDFVVWPEFAGIPFTRSGDPNLLVDLSAGDGISPLITSYQDSLLPMHHNTSALFSKGEISGLYWKRKLFGAESQMHVPGNQAVSATYKHRNVGLNICFDSCYPAIIRETASLPGVNIVSLSSIDPYVTNNFVAAIHAAYTPFRSAEEGVSIVKADGMAYSAFADPYGQIIKELPPGDRIDHESVPISTHWTPYKQFGDWFLYLLAAMTVGEFIRVRLRNRPKSRVSSDSSEKAS